MLLVPLVAMVLLIITTVVCFRMSDFQLVQCFEAVLNLPPYHHLGIHLKAIGNLCF